MILIKKIKNGVNPIYILTRSRHQILTKNCQKSYIESIISQKIARYRDGNLRNA